MAVVRRMVETRFWNDPQVIDSYSVEDKYFLLYLMTNPATTQLGIYQLPKKIMSFECGYSTDVINVLLERFQNKYNCILYSEATQEVALINSLSYSILKGGKPVTDLLQKELTHVRDGDLIYETYEHMMGYWNQSHRPVDQIIKELFEHELRKRNKMIKSNEIHTEIQNLNEIQNNNDIYNDNHNEESYHESYNDSLNDSNIMDQLELITNYYVQTFGKISYTDSQRIKGWLPHLSVDRIIEAFERSKDKTSPMLYAQAIVNSWL